MATEESTSSMVSFQDVNSDIPSTELIPVQLSIVSTQTLKIIYLIIGLLGLIGNIVVILVMLTYKQLRTGKTNFYIINQSFVDGTVSLMLVLTNLIEDDGRFLQGISDNVYCKVWLTKIPLWGLLVSSSYNMVIMTIERYISVVYPIWHKTRLTNKMVFTSIVPAWVIGLLYQGAFKIPTSVIIDGKCFLFYEWPSLTAKRIVGVLTVTVQYIIPLIVVGVCYSRMAYALHLRVRQAPAHDETAPSGQIGKKNDQMARARKNVIKTLALVSVAFFLCWTINQMYFLLSNLGLPLNFKSVFYHTSVILVFINCCINPMIYLIKYELYQEGLKSFVAKVTFGKIKFESRRLAEVSVSDGNVTNE